MSPSVFNPRTQEHIPLDQLRYVTRWEDDKGRPVCLVNEVLGPTEHTHFAPDPAFILFFVEEYFWADGRSDEPVINSKHGLPTQEGIKHLVIGAQQGQQR